MDIELSNLIKQTFEDSKNKLNEIEKMENDFNEKKNEYEKQEKEFNEQYAREDSDNPAYEDMRKQKQKNLEEEKKNIDKEKENLDKMREEFEQNFKKSKEEILTQTSENREQLKQEYEAKKAEPEKRLQELQKQKEFAEKDIEASLRGIEYEKINVKNSGYDGALKFKEEVLKERQKRLEDINTEIEELNNRDFEQEFMEKILPDFNKKFDELSDIESKLKEPYTTKVLVESLGEIVEKDQNNRENSNKDEIEQELSSESEEEMTTEQEQEIKPEQEEEEEPNIELDETLEAHNAPETNLNEEKKKRPFNVPHVVDFDKNGDGIFAKDFNNRQTDIDFTKNGKEMFDKDFNNGQPESVEFKITPNGVPMYFIKYKGQEEKTVTVSTEKSEYKDKKIVEKAENYHIKDFDKICNKINKGTYQFDKNEILDPFLIATLGIENAYNMLFNNDYGEKPNIKYDMSNIKKIPLIHRGKFKKIARNLIKNDITVEGYKPLTLAGIKNIIPNLVNKIQERKLLVTNRNNLLEEANQKIDATGTPVTTDVTKSIAGVGSMNKTILENNINYIEQTHDEDIKNRLKVDISLKDQNQNSKNIIDNLVNQENNSLENDDKGKEYSNE